MNDDTELPQDSIAIVWSLEDIAERCDSLETPLSIEEQRRVLHLLKHNHDATIGINWDVIDAMIWQVEAERRKHQPSDPRNGKQ